MVNPNPGPNVQCVLVPPLSHDCQMLILKSLREQEVGRGILILITRKVGLDDEVLGKAELLEPLNGISVRFGNPVLRPDEALDALGGFDGSWIHWRLTGSRCGSNASASLSLAVVLLV